MAERRVMLGKTHLSAGIMAGIMYANSKGLALNESAVLISVASLGSLVPDLDTPKSKLGVKVLPISFCINKIFGHRNFWHSPLCYILISLIWYIIFPSLSMYILPFIIGIATHIFLDMLTVQGLPILYPYKKRFRLARLQTGSIIEYFLISAFSIVAVANGVTYFGLI